MTDTDDELLAKARKLFGDEAGIAGLVVYDYPGNGSEPTMLRAPDRETLAAWLTAMAFATAVEPEPEVVLDWPGGRVLNDGAIDWELRPGVWSNTGPCHLGLANAITAIRAEAEASKRFIRNGRDHFKERATAAERVVTAVTTVMRVDSEPDIEPGQLHLRVSELRSSFEEAGRQRDEWRKRALSAQRQLELIDKEPA